MAVRKRLRGWKLNNWSHNRPLDGRDQADAVHMSAVVDGSAVLMLRAVRMWPGLRAAILVSMVARRPNITVGRRCSHSLVMDRTVAGQSIQEFAQQVNAFATEHQVARTIVDVRHNLGGNNSAPLETVLKNNPQINQPGRLFVLVGRNTFSAAIKFLVNLEKDTHAVFVGEPTGGRPNFYAGQETTRLQYSGIEVLISRTLWRTRSSRISSAGVCRSSRRITGRLRRRQTMRSILSIRTSMSSPSLGSVAVSPSVRPSIGSAIGAVLIQTVKTGLVFTAMNLYLQPLVLAGVIFAAVLIDSLRASRLRSARRRMIRPAA